MINVLKSVLQEGMKIDKIKEMANEYRVTLKYNGMVGNCSVSKMCSPGNEKSLCMKSIDTAISGMYINAGNLAEAKAWLDGERWNKKITMTDKQKSMISGMDLLLRKISKYSNDTTFTVEEIIELSNKTYDEIMEQKE